jgi:lipoyl(octanoyl) transferase
MSPSPWRLVAGAGADSDGILAGEPVPSRGATNMAVDHALFESVRLGGPPVVRLYTWRPACLSFGRNQHARGCYDESAIRAAGLDLVRRPTGGLAVLHDDELTYCVAAPAALLGGPRHIYHTINAALVAGLRMLGAPVELSGARRAVHPRHDAQQPCFHAPAEGEVIAAGRKLVGSAQRAEGGAILQHGSILISGSQDRVSGFVDPPLHAGRAAAAGTAGATVRAAPAAQFTTLDMLLGGRPAWQELAAAVAAGFEAVCGTRLAPGSLTREEMMRLPGLQAGYEDAGWTWRR